MPILTDEKGVSGVVIGYPLLGFLVLDIVRNDICSGEFMRPMYNDFSAVPLHC